MSYGKVIGASTKAMVKDEMLFYNGKIYTLENEHEFFSSMLIKKGRISRLTNDYEIDKVANGTKLYNLNGKTIIPGLIDSHIHFMSTAVLQEIALNIAEIKDEQIEPKDFEGIKAKIADFIRYKKKTSKDLILCFNFIASAITEARLPNRFELDSWFPGNPIIIISIDGHSSSYSTKALEMIRGSVSDQENGILSGKVNEEITSQLSKLVLKFLTPQTLIKGVQNLVNDAIDYGIVGMHCFDGFDEDPFDPTVWLLIHFSKLIPLNLTLYLQYKNLKRVSKYNKYMKYLKIGGCGAWCMDGSVSSKTAAFFTAYKDEPANFGQCYFSDEEIYALVNKAYLKGFQISAHAIGDKGIEKILKAYEKVMAENNDTHNKMRQRIEHYEFPKSDQLIRAADKLQLIISAQPGYSWMDNKYQQNYQKHLTQEIYNRQIPLKTLVEKGAIICGSSDSPVQHLNPFLQIHGMVNFPIQSERLTVYQAFRTYTYNGAYATFDEKEYGTISEGKIANFIILEADPFKMDKSKLYNLKVAETYIKGKRILQLKHNYISFLIKSLLFRNKLL